MAGISLSKDSLDDYVCSANSAIELKLVQLENDIEDDKKAFHPEYTHQFFGDSESIFGYRDLKVQLYYSAARLTTFLGLKFVEKITPDKSDGVQADEVINVIGEKLQPGFYQNRDDFIASLAKDANFKPHGELLHSFNKEEENTKRTFEVYRATALDPGFKEYHERMQTFVLWYIDAASFIDIDDELWEFFVMFEKLSCDGEPRYCFVGYMTVYRYYAYPNKKRPRISQMLVLPPFQKNGLGAEMLQTVYNWYVKDPDVVDITVEDPSEEFTRLRDFVDSKNSSKLTSFQSENLLKGFSKEMVSEAQETLKMNKKQTRKVYEILRLQATNTADVEQYRAYRLDVKNRLNLPYKKQQADLAKLKKTLRPEELRAALQYTNKEQRIEQLEKQYREVEVEYRHVLERLATSSSS
ncbi:histone acetyltransferase 1 [Tachypleus tridentatus]|uniref:histone acetyltransferase 1 n=1 Tax=Tachypleus tridentatus TaxID=6853 RepID=UPI003FD239FD